MDIGKHRAKLLKNLASLPGGRDRIGGPLIVVDPPLTQSPKGASTSDLGSLGFPYEDFVSLLGYLAQVAEPKAVAKGLCVLVDGRKTPAKVLKTIIRGCQQALYKKIRLCLIVQPEKFFEQQKINMDLILEGFEFKTQLISVHKLSKYVDISQLPEQFGGNLAYDAEEWSNNREKIECCLSRLRSRQKELDGQPLADEEDCFKEGETLAVELSQSPSNHENISAAGQIKQAIEEVKIAATRPEKEARQQKEAEENREKIKMIEEHAAGINRLLDWIEGPGEKWLLTLHEIGESRDGARQFVKEHQQLAQKSKEILSQSEELAELATRLMAAVPAHSITLAKARDQVRLVCQQFNNRVERQTEMARRSEQFHGLLGDLSRKTDLLLESLCTEPKVSELAGAEAERTAIEEKVTIMEKIYETVCETGAAFVEDLATSEYNSFGNRIIRDYSTGIVHIRDQLAAVRERRKRCLDLLDVRRLKLQQFIQLFTCENDAHQAIKWLEELHETLLKDYNQIGCDEQDIGHLREDRLKLEETARSTYEYGRQLCQVGMVLRRSLRLDSQPQTNINNKLEQTWGRLCRALADNEAKLNCLEAFNSTIVEINRRIDEMERRSKDKMTPGRDKRTLFQTERRRLAGDIQELSHIRDMLAAQINANHNASVEARQAAISTIRKKVEGVENRHRQMESLFLETPPNEVEESTRDLGSIRLSETESYL